MQTAVLHLVINCFLSLQSTKDGIPGSIETLSCLTHIVSLSFLLHTVDQSVVIIRTKTVVHVIYSSDYEHQLLLNLQLSELTLISLELQPVSHPGVYYLSLLNLPSGVKPRSAQ